MIETYISCLEERLLDIEIPSKRFDNLTKEEQKALYSLKDDPSIITKGTDKGSVAVVWDREDDDDEHFYSVRTRFCKVIYIYIYIYIYI